MPIRCNPADTTFTWRGITLAMSGDPTFTTDTKITGADLLDVDPTDLPVSMGTQPGRISWPARDIIATAVACLTPATAEALRAAMLTGDADAAPEPLTIDAPTMWPDTRLLWAVPRRCTSSVARAQMVTRGLLRDLLWTGHDPRLYSTDETDFALPATVVHDGNTAAPWRAVIVGPIVGPELRRTDTDQAIRWPTVTVPAGEFLDVDLRTGVAWVGDLDVSGLAVDDDDRPPVEWEVPPGEDGVPMTTNGPSATVWVRSTWL